MQDFSNLKPDTKIKGLSPTGIAPNRFWTLDTEGKKLRLVIEAHRIRAAHHFDPYMTMHASHIDPLPHQIDVVYNIMLPRHPIRFLLADDPGAGKTIMAGLLLKELIARGDVERCLIIAPGSLVEQWQDELEEKFNIKCAILNREKLETASSENPFNDKDMLIARLDVLARNEDLQEKLTNSKTWDIIIADEAHRMSASVFSKEIKKTKRYQLGQRLADICRHLLLMSATPHNGKEEDFQLFMALLDNDRFEGRHREGAPIADMKDMMRRLTKEDLLTFDGVPLFPERRAYTIKYTLSDNEAALYTGVTNYVRTEMNRTHRFTENDNKKRVNVSFALQILQRRLASSPAAIHNSLKRRRKRLETELEKAQNTHPSSFMELSPAPDDLISDDILHIDEYAQDDIDRIEDTISATVTMAETVEQLAEEVKTLKRLEGQSLAILRSGQDTKWQQLNKILDDDLMRDSDQVRRKLIIFTEAKDTLLYLVDKIRTRLGTPDAVDFIHGSVSREERRRIIHRFMQDKDLQILVANDAAGEGVNLQRGHLMVNYDLPWNPNKIEQRFGRIHRIGQTEVCHLWNLVAAETREGEVYAKLLDKLATARGTLQGQVFDVLGHLFENISLKNLLWDAIQYGEQPEIRARLHQTMEGIFDIDHITGLMQDHKLTDDILPASHVHDIRFAIEKAAAHRLQPHHIEGFFLEAFTALGGNFKLREFGRYEITFVPQHVRDCGQHAPVDKHFERICFDKSLINQHPIAEFICPGHPLLESVLDLIHLHYADLMHQGSVMVAPSDYSAEVQVVFLVEHEVYDARPTVSGMRQVISKKLHFARLSRDGCISYGGIAPHLDLRPISSDERAIISSALDESWLNNDIESQIKSFLVEGLAKTHLDDVRARRMPEIDKVEREVRSCLTAEINYWYSRASNLRADEQAGKKTKLHWQNAKRRVEDIEGRLHRRMSQLDQERSIMSSSPVILGCIAVIPQGYLEAHIPVSASKPDHFAESSMSRQEVEILAMEAVMAVERGLGNQPKDVSADKVGYDILSIDPVKKKHRY